MSGGLEQAGPLIEERKQRGRRLGRVWALATAPRCQGLLAAAPGGRRAQWPGGRACLVPEPKNVGAHLSRVYRKLGVGSRVQLAHELAHRIGQHPGW